MNRERILKEASLSLVQHECEPASAHDDRLMVQAVEIFAAITDVKLSEQQGWMFMVALKLARTTRGKPNPGHYVDLAGYTALLGESALEGRFDESPKISS